MSYSSTLEPAEAVPRRVERDTYSVADVRKALCFLLAHVEKGDAPPTPWTVAHKLLKMPAMYYPVRACLLSPSVCGLAAATPIRVLPCATPAVARARARFSCVWTRPNPCAEALVALGHACAQLKNAWAAIEKMPADARRVAIAAYELPRKGGTQHGIKIFSDDEEEILVSFCNMAAVTTVAVACSPCRDAPASHDCDRNHKIGQRRRDWLT